MPAEVKKYIKKGYNTCLNNTKEYLKNNALFLVFIFSSLINGWLLRCYTVKNILAMKPILGDLALIILIGALGYFIKPKHRFRYYFIISTLFAILCMINAVYYSNYSSYVSLSLISTLPQVFGVTDAVDSIMKIKDFLFLWAPLAVFFTNKGVKTVAEKKGVGKILALNTLVVGLIFLGFFLSSLTSLDYGRLGKQWNREYVVMQFGIYFYQFNDIFVSLKPEVMPLFGYDNAYKEFKEYYDTREGYDQTKNKYTNILKGKNVIAIHAESIQNFVLDLTINGQEVAPNLKKLAREGIYFSNFYAQQSVGTSSDTEFTISTSLMPATTGTVAISYWDRDYITNYKLLKDQGYYIFSMHGNNGTYWNRNVFHKQLGYDDFYYYTKDYTIDEKIGLGLSDKSFFTQSVPIIKNIKETKKAPYYGTLIMLTNHTPFTWIDEFSDFDVTYHYKDELGIEQQANYLEGTKLGSYLKSVHYADEALGEFIENLKKEGLLKNTVFVIYGDHDARISRSEFMRLYNYDYKTDSILEETDPNYIPYTNYDNILNYKVPFIIWNSDKQYKTEVTKVMGMYDVAPTLGNMLGIYNKYALGHDIFNIKDNVVVFPEGNWLTDKLYYNSQKEEMYTLTIEPIEQSYIDYYKNYSEKIISISNDIIVYNLIEKDKQVEEINNLNN